MDKQRLRRVNLISIWNMLLLLLNEKTKLGLLAADEALLCELLGRDVVCGKNDHRSAQRKLINALRLDCSTANNQRLEEGINTVRIILYIIVGMLGISIGLLLRIAL